MSNNTNDTDNTNVCSSGLSLVSYHPLNAPLFQRIGISSDQGFFSIIDDRHWSTDACQFL